MATYNFDNYETVIMNGTEMFQVKYGSTVVYNKTLINFDERGGGAVSNKYVHYKRAYGTLPTTSKSYSTFNGWYTGINQSGSKIISTTTLNSILVSQTLYAAWTPSQSGYKTNTTNLNLSYDSSGNVALNRYSGATKPTAYYWYFGGVDSGRASLINSTSQTVTVRNTNGSANEIRGYLYCRITVDGKYLYYTVALTLQKASGGTASQWVYVASSSSQLDIADQYLGSLEDAYYNIHSAYPASNYPVGWVVSVWDPSAEAYYYFEAS